jgi:glycosyltransferase involved in cell wall biosynthesis
METESTYLSIVIPLYNEEESIEKIVTRIIEVGKSFNFSYEIILVDDGSTDETWKIIEDLKASIPNLIGIKLRKNYGQTAAMVAGFDHSSGEIIVTMDGDLQNDPLDISRLLEKIEDGFDIVSGWRKYRKDHYSRVIPSRIANYIISKSTGISLHDYGCSLKAYRADCIKSITAYSDMHRFFPALASMTGAQVTEIPVNHYPRRYGVSKYGLDRIFKVFSDIFSLNLILRFSSKPLKGFVLCALPLLFLTFFFGFVGFIATVFQWTEGKSFFFIIATALSGMAAAHLIFMGVLGELAVGLSDIKNTQVAELKKL